MIGVLSHCLSLNGELVYTTRTNGGGRLCAKQKALWQLLDIFKIFMRTIVKAWYLHCSSHTIIYNCIGMIHSLCYRTCRVELMTKLLQAIGYLCATVAIVLVGNFITYTPHHDARIVAIVTHQMVDISLSPFVKKLMIAILHFRCNPLIERLAHKHHSHLIASLHQLRRRHIVRSTNSITAHVLENANLTTNSSHVYFSTQCS